MLLINNKFIQSCIFILICFYMIKQISAKTIFAKFAFLLQGFFFFFCENVFYYNKA